MSRMTVTIDDALLEEAKEVPATDLIIAASAIHAQAELLHVDDYFDEIAKVSVLACRNPSKPA